MFTAGALEQGRNGGRTSARRSRTTSPRRCNGNTYPLFPCDANAIQAAYEYATNSYNKCMVIIASKSALPVYMSASEARHAVEAAWLLFMEDFHPRSVFPSKDF